MGFVKEILLLIAACCLTAGAFAQDSTDVRTPWRPVVSYIGDAAGNLSGGMERGGGYLGYAVLGISYNGEESGRWRNGGFTLTGGWTHGCTPSESWIGDLQVADYIEAGNHLFLQECYLWQRWGNWEATLGMQDFCAHFCFADAANLYFNSSFGISSALSCNHQLSFFPLFTWGANLRWQPSSSFRLQAALFDTPIDWEDNPYNLKWRFQKEKGANMVVEGEYDTKMGTVVKMAIVAQSCDWTVSVQASAEQCLLETERHILRLFGMGAVHLSESCTHPLQYAFGANLSGLFFRTGNDVLGLAVTNAAIRWEGGSFRNETAVELTWQWGINEHFYIQPDLQYIVRPSGSDVPLDNALFSALRIGFEW